MTEEKLSQLEQRVNQLLEWKRSMSLQRIKIPFDTTSKNAIQKSSVNPPLVATGKVFSSVVPINDMTGVGLWTSLNGFLRAVLASVPVHAFTADASSNVLTNTSGAHNLINGDRLTLVSDDTLPDPLQEVIVDYYVINASGSTFKVSETLGGSEVDILDAGLGTHYWAKNIYWA